MNLSKLFILLISLIFFSCEQSNINKYISNKAFFKTTDEKKNKAISQINYNFEYSASEKFEINKALYGLNIYHKTLPVPSVVKLSNINNTDNFIIVRNTFIDSSSKYLEISTKIQEMLSLDSNIYVEYLSDESKNLKSVELSKTTSVVKLNNSKITTEDLNEKPSEISNKIIIDEERLKKLDENLLNDSIFIFIDKYSNYNEARLNTNKIMNLNITISSEKDFYEVLAGPFGANNINETLSFLLNNGYENAKIYN